MTVRKMTFYVFLIEIGIVLEVQKNFVAVEERPDFCVGIEPRWHADRCRAWQSLRRCLTAWASEVAGTRETVRKESA
jgi:hypothetical protein